MDRMPRPHKVLVADNHWHAKDAISRVTTDNRPDRAGTQELFDLWIQRIGQLGYQVRSHVCVVPDYWVNRDRPYPAELAPLQPRTTARIASGLHRFANRQCGGPASPLGIPAQLPPDVEFRHGMFWVSPRCSPLDEAQARFRRTLTDGLWEARRA